MLASESKQHLSAMKINSETDQSPGDQGMKIWYLNRLEEIPAIARRHALCDPVSVTMWITPRDDAHETLCFGTGLGYLVFWRRTGKAKTVRNGGNAT